MNSRAILGGRVVINLPDTNVTRAPVAALVPANRAAVSGVYTDEALTTAYTTGAVQGGTLYFKLSDLKTFNSGAKVSVWDTADEAATNATAMTVVKSTSGGGYVTVEVVLMEDDTAPMLDGANYLYHSDTIFNGSLIHAWCHSGDITTLEIYQALSSTRYSPNILGAEANWSTPVASDLSPSSPVFLEGAELYVTSTCDNGTIIELVIDPWVMGHRL